MSVIEFDARETRVIAQLEDGRVVYSGWGTVVRNDFDGTDWLLTSSDVADWVLSEHGPFYWRVV